MSHVFRIFSLGTALAIAACSAPTPSSAIPAPDTAPSRGRGADCLSVIHRDLTSSRRHRVHSATLPNYVYVTVSVPPRTYNMEIYPAGVSNPSPIGSQCFEEPATQVATDQTGQVYVVIPSQNNTDGRVDIFSDGGSSLVGTLGSSSGITKPQAVTVDNNDNLYVADSSQNHIYVFRHNATTPFCTLASTINIPVGVATDASDNVYVRLFATGTFFGEFSSGCPQGGPTLLPFISFNPAGAIAVDPAGELVFGSGDYLEFYARSGSGWYNSKSLLYSTNVTGVTTGPAGELYVAHGSAVTVIPNALELPYDITSGVENAAAAAGGV